MLKFYKEILCLFLFCYFNLQATCLDDYFLFYEKYPACLGEKGNHEYCEIEILFDPLKIKQCEQIQKSRLIKKGWDEKKASKAATVGVVLEDPYWIVIRDAVLFPSGVFGTFDRLITKSSLYGSAGVGVLPILSDDRFLLVLQYRHATRSWQLELPRGGKDPNETEKEAALRELKEETGAIAKTVDFLGKIQPDSGMCSSEASLYLAHIESIGDTEHEKSEAIYKTVFLTKNELEKAIVEGFIELNILGKSQKIGVKDSFLAFAYLQAKLRGLFK